MPRCFECDAFVGSEDVCGVCRTAICSTCCLNYDVGGSHDADAHLTPAWDAPEPDADIDDEEMPEPDEAEVFFQEQSLL